MPISVSYDAGECLINIAYQGTLEPEMLSDVIAEAATLSNEHHCFHFLEDFREAQIRLSVMDIYAVPSFISEQLSKFGIKGREFKRALIAGKGWKDLYFFETVSFNRAQNVKVFREIEEAKRWLSEK